jgi:lipopolysaccharide transport system permease protein
MYATPIIYPATLIPERWRWMLALNPLTGLVDGFRAAFLGKAFDWPAIAASVVIAVAVFAAGVAYFESAERRFADVI